jgi:hypothetical protein
MIEFKYCTEVKLDGPLDRSLRLFRSKPKDTSVLEETYFLAENENPNRGSMDIAIKLTIDTNGGQRRLIEAHAIFSDGNEKQKSMLMLPNKYSFFY